MYQTGLRESFRDRGIAPLDRRADIAWRATREPGRWSKSVALSIAHSSFCGSLLMLLAPRRPGMDCLKFTTSSSNNATLPRPEEADGGGGGWASDAWHWEEGHNPHHCVTWVGPFVSGFTKRKHFGVGDNPNALSSSNLTQRTGVS